MRLDHLEHKETSILLYPAFVKSYKPKTRVTLNGLKRPWTTDWQGTDSNCSWAITISRRYDHQGRLGWLMTKMFPCRHNTVDGNRWIAILGWHDLEKEVLVGFFFRRRLCRPKICISHIIGIVLTRAWQGYLHNTTDMGRGYFLPPPLRTQELRVGFTKFKWDSIDLESLLRET